MFSTRENTTHIFKPLCNFCLTYRQTDCLHKQPPPKKKNGNDVINTLSHHLWGNGNATLIPDVVSCKFTSGGYFSEHISDTSSIKVGQIHFFILSPVVDLRSELQNVVAYLEICRSANKLHLNLPIVASTQPTVPSPPQQRTRKSGTPWKNFRLKHKTTIKQGRVKMSYKIHQRRYAR